MNDRINVALMAYGMSGSVFHAPLIDAHPRFNLKKIMVRSGNQQARERYPQTEIVTDYTNVIKDETIDLVVINTPEHTHFELGKAALSAGKNVIVEKAFTVNSSEARELINLAREKQVMLSVFQNARWHGDFMTIQKVVAKEMLGRLICFEAHYDRYRNFIQPDNWKEEPKPGTGSLYNLGPHLIDQVLVLFGYPQSLYADLQIQRKGGKVIDYFELQLYFNDLKVTLKSSYLVREPGPRYMLHGEAGSFIKYGGDPQEAFLKAGGSPLEESFGHEPESFWGIMNTYLNGMHFEGRIETEKGSYLGYYDNIYNVLKDNEELIVKPEQALQTIKIIEAAIQSSHEKQMIILAG